MRTHSEETLAARLQALADPTRLRLLELTRSGEPTASDCIAALGLSQPRVARHLRILVDAGFLRSRREGRFVVYSHEEDGATALLIPAVLAALTEVHGGGGSTPTPPGPSGPEVRTRSGATRLPTPSAIRTGAPDEPGEEDLPDDRPARPMEDFLL